MCKLKKGQEAPFEGILLSKIEYKKYLRDKEILDNLEKKLKQ